LDYARVALSDIAQATRCSKLGIYHRRHDCPIDHPSQSVAFVHPPDASSSEKKSSPTNVCFLSIDVPRVP
jgi:hypothetical protein